jgi:hypothetical protein
MPRRIGEPTASNAPNTGAGSRRATQAAVHGPPAVWHCRKLSPLQRNPSGAARRHRKHLLREPHGVTICSWTLYRPVLVNGLGMLSKVPLPVAPA